MITKWKWKNNNNAIAHMRRTPSKVSFVLDDVEVGRARTKKKIREPNTHKQQPAAKSMIFYLNLFFPLHSFRFCLSALGIAYARHDFLRRYTFAPYFLSYDNLVAALSPSLATSACRSNGCVFAHRTYQPKDTRSRLLLLLDFYYLFIYVLVCEAFLRIRVLSFCLCSFDFQDFSGLPETQFVFGNMLAYTHTQRPDRDRRCDGKQSQTKFSVLLGIEVENGHIIGILHFFFSFCLHKIFLSFSYFFFFFFCIHAFAQRPKMKTM